MTETETGPVDCGREWCCTTCQGAGWAGQEPCSDCYGTGHTHLTGETP
jgi:DnaJ-class molecular chaperone